MVKIELNNLRSQACYVEPIVDDTITSPLRDLRNKTTRKKISINLRIQTAAAAYVETKQSKKHGLFQNRNDTFSSVDVRI